METISDMALPRLKLKSELHDAGQAPARLASGCSLVLVAIGFCFQLMPNMALAQANSVKWPLRKSNARLSMFVSTVSDC